MAAERFFYDNGGRMTDKAATQTSSGAADAGKIPALDETGRLSIDMMPTGVTAEVKSCPASENISGGQLVNLWNDAGTLKARKADATTAGKEADGYVKDAVTTGNTATVYVDSINTGITGLVAGTVYFLDTTAGGVTATAPSAAGNVVQEIGKASASGELIFRPLGRGWVKA